MKSLKIIISETLFGLLGLPMIHLINDKSEKATYIMIKAIIIKCIPVGYL